jgi:hypothetical protein
MNSVQIDLTTREVHVVSAVLLHIIQSNPELQKEIDEVYVKLQAKVGGK